MISRHNSFFTKIINEYSRITFFRSEKGRSYRLSGNCLELHSTKYWLVPGSILEYLVGKKTFLMSGYWYQKFFEDGLTNRFIAFTDKKKDSQTSLMSLTTMVNHVKWFLKGK